MRAGPFSPMASWLARTTIRWAGYAPQRVERNWLVRPAAVTPEEQARQLLHFVRDSHPELETIDHIVRLLEHYRVNVVLDVGANVGQYAMRLRSGGYRGHIVSFEPIQDVFNRLQHRARSDSRWTAYRMALGSAAGEFPLHIARNSVFSSFLIANQNSQRLFGLFAEAERTEMVPVRTLDEVVGDAIAAVESPQLFLKLDTQGYDLQVCAGGVASLSRIIGVQTELSVRPLYDAMPGWLEAIKFFERAGFALADLLPISYDPSTRQVIELDGLFVRPALA